MNTSQSTESTLRLLAGHVGQVWLINNCSVRTFDGVRFVIGCTPVARTLSEAVRILGESN